MAVGLIDTAPEADCLKGRAGGGHDINEGTLTE